MGWDNLDFEEIRHVCIYIYRREIGREEHLVIYNKISVSSGCVCVYQEGVCVYHQGVCVCVCVFLCDEGVCVFVIRVCVCVCVCLCV